MDEEEIEHELTDHEDNRLTNQDLAEIQMEHVPGSRTAAQHLDQVEMENGLTFEEEELDLLSDHSSESDG